MTLRQLQFGYYPRPLDLHLGLIKVTSLPDLEQAIDCVKASDTIENDWIYAPPRLVRHFPSGEIRTRPYPSRIFRLPKTHFIEHGAADSEDQLAFHIWSLSFFVGMRLTATEAGFIDATPIKPGKLVDFVLLGPGLARSIEITEAFWVVNRNEPRRAQLFAAAVHALFLSQNPQCLQFEEFIYLCSALDACFALAGSIAVPPKRLGYGKRVEWLCSLFGMATPGWAVTSPSGRVDVAAIRNGAIHEALFVGEPLGFALHGAGTNQNLTLEMQALVCRLLVVPLCAAASDYVRSPIDTRQRHGLDLR